MRAGPANPRRLFLVADGQRFAAFGASPTQDLAAIRGCHARAEAVLAGAFDFGWTICWLHDENTFLIRGGVYLVIRGVSMFCSRFCSRFAVVFSRGWVGERECLMPPLVFRAGLLHIMRRLKLPVRRGRTERNVLCEQRLMCLLRVLVHGDFAVEDPSRVEVGADHIAAEVRHTDDAVGGFGGLGRT